MPIVEKWQLHSSYRVGTLQKTMLGKNIKPPALGL
jgi:hypothetical protein